MSNFKENCILYFGTNDFYEILKIDKKVTSKEIKKAYRKLSLIVHPDRVEASQKLVATEKFKVLGKIHSVLQDEAKRKIYDECGEYDEDTDTDFNWMEYWRSLFKKISLTDIEKCEKEYIGSELELRDIKKSYIASKGDLNIMHDTIPFINCENEPRIIEIVRGLVERGEVEEYDRFFNEPARKRQRRHTKYRKEREEIERDNAMTEQVENAAAEIQKQCASRFLSMVSNLEAKYGNKTPPSKKRKSLKKN